MVRRIIWSESAKNDLLEIFNYWNNRNKSYTYSRKLNRLFKDSVRIIARYPGIGRQSHIPHIRLFVIRHYLIIYEWEKQDNRIIIHIIWDARRDPENLMKLLQKF